MKVSILMVTYNHEKYIAEALDSVLMQQVDFDYEIVIGDDCSTDNTRSILIDYHRKNPDKIRLLLQERNLGLYGKYNFIQTYNACQGQYIAMLEGDDYWISPDKLQKQVDFLDTHPNCSLCFHASKLIFEDGSGRKSVLYVPPEIKPFYTIEDVLGKRDFIHTASAMFRRGLFGEFPEWFLSPAPGDCVLYILCGQYGTIGYIDEGKSVYRIHKGGIWSSKGLIQRLLIQIELLRTINAHLNFRYDKIIKSTISSFYYRIAEEYRHNNSRSKALINLLKCIITSPFNQPVPPHRSFLRMAAWNTPKPVRRIIRLLLGLSRMGNKA
jgi:glycosyltransferase involved in cell wall biosynthesis